jgi:NADH:ubiquinone oxidoreductase subunit K
LCCFAANLFVAQRRTNNAMTIFCSIEFVAVAFTFAGLVRYKTKLKAQQFTLCWMFVFAAASVAHMFFEH